MPEPTSDFFQEKMCCIIVVPNKCGHESKHVLMVCHAPKYIRQDSFEAFCDNPKIQALKQELSVGYECAICSKVAPLKVHPANGLGGGMKGNEIKGKGKENEAERPRSGTPRGDGRRSGNTKGS